MEQAYLLGMVTYIHRNKWPWGRKDTIVMANGCALCQLSIENDNPAVAHLSDVIVWEPARGRGLGNDLLRKAKEHAREMGAKMLCLWADPEQWVVDWYKRHGFMQQCVYDDGMVGLTFDLE